MTRSYSGTTCSSSPSSILRQFRYTGGSCALISASPSATWGGISCTSDLVANFVFFSDSQCAGAPFTQPETGLGLCSLTGDGRSSITTCVSGAFPEPGPQGGFINSLYSAPASCPLTTQTRDDVFWYAAGVCAQLSATTSAIITCSATGFSAQQWTNPTCSGAPSSTGSQQLGCSTPAGSSGALLASCTFNPFYSVAFVNRSANDENCITSCDTEPPALDLSPNFFSVSGGPVSLYPPVPIPIPRRVRTSFFTLRPTPPPPHPHAPQNSLQLQQHLTTPPPRILACPNGDLRLLVPLICASYLGTTAGSPRRAN